VPRKRLPCPFTGEHLLAVPALYPDVAAIHVHEAESLRQLSFSRHQCRRPRSCSRRQDTHHHLRTAHSRRRDSPGPDADCYSVLLCDAVCEVPFGSYPGNMPYEYFSDEDHLRKWLQAERDPEEYRRFLDEYIFSVKDFADYLHKCGGLPRLQELRAVRNCSYIAAVRRCLDFFPPDMRSSSRRGQLCPVSSLIPHDLAADPHTCSPGREGAMSTVRSSPESVAPSVRIQTTLPRRSSSPEPLTFRATPLGRFLYHTFRAAASLATGHRPAQHLHALPHHRDASRIVLYGPRCPGPDLSHLVVHAPAFSSWPSTSSAPP